MENCAEVKKYIISKGFDIGDVILTNTEIDLENPKTYFISDGEIDEFDNISKASFILERNFGDNILFICKDSLSKLDAIINRAKSASKFKI